MRCRDTGVVSRLLKKLSHDWKRTDFKMADGFGTRIKRAKKFKKKMLVLQNTLLRK